MKRATIRDVAEKAGVSISTVSRVLNNPEAVTEEKGKKVLEVIEELGYSPNALARGLIHKRTKTLGVLVPDVSNIYAAGVLRGMEDAARERGLNLIICNTDLKRERMTEYLHILSEKQVDGIIYTSEPVFPDVYEAFQRLKLPVVLASTHSLEYPLPSVKIHDEQAAYEATQYLIKQGHTEIGMISGPLSDPIAGLPRLQGYMRAILEQNWHYHFEQTVEYGHYRYEDGFEAMERLHRKYPQLTAVFCASDEMALGVISYLAQQGMSVPHDVSVVGFDNTRIAHICLPKLTTVSQPLHDIGYCTVQKMEELLEHGEVKELRTYLPHQLVIRDSVRSLV
ncbi:LacI family transcriptional regulator [Caldalkalibacillus thermarum TA2.A1]|uniref:LacI family transcriptional regulator n=1 Tax=Caldalkalibacillus thermarum (strain TA2.A1) TaxID=986075 RepID=A0A8X8I3R7_CALTT|nr:LacI family DNA-binding transcriptional regulator [Caldalkalibacillus thermarum]QZT33816.1 LacI family transcriptional regulator [Caldalkalibacillus thermarum TA2.A1]